MHPLLECGREDLGRALLDDHARLPRGSFFWEAEWLVYLLRTGRLDLAHDSGVLDPLERLPERGDFNDRPSEAFGAIWLLYTGFSRPPF